MTTITFDYPGERPTYQLQRSNSALDVFTATTMCLFKKIDLNICGLLLSALLFIIPASVFLTLGFMCTLAGKRSREYRDSIEACRRMDSKTDNILLIFGFVYMFVGLLVTVFAYLVSRATAREAALARTRSLRVNLVWVNHWAKQEVDRQVGVATVMVLEIK